MREQCSPPKFHRSERGVSRRTECGHELCAESVPIAPTEMHLSIRTAANPGARCSETEIEGDPLSREWAARAPQSRRVGGAGIFPRVVSRRPYLLWPCRRRLSSPGGSQPLTPGSGAWLFPDCRCGSDAMNQRGRPTLYRPEYPDLVRRLCLLGGTNAEKAVGLLQGLFNRKKK